MRSDPLSLLAEQLREEDSLLSPHVVEPAPGSAGLGMLAAAGRGAADGPAVGASYALLIESIREGYLLHYATPRVLAGLDPDLALLAGDYLFARGIEQLAALGDLGALRELVDLIALSAQIHGGASDRAQANAPPLWLACVGAVAAGPSDGHEAAKRSLIVAAPEAGRILAAAARETARRGGLDEQLSIAAESIGFPIAATP